MMTLRELTCILPMTKGFPKPGKNVLRNSQTNIIVRHPLDAEAQPGVDGIFVYENGFILYQHKDYGCVLRIDDCMWPYTYSSVKGTGETIPVECFMEMDWKIPITLIGEDRITFNRSIQKERFEVPISSMINVGDYEDRKALTLSFDEEINSKLTEKQKEIYNLHFMQNYTAPEIGRLKGITPRAVHFCLAEIKKKIKKYLETTTD